MHHTPILHRPAVTLTRMHTILSGIGIMLLMLVSPVSFAAAQQLRLVDGNATTMIEDPGTYRAYYGKLSGEPHIYTFKADADIVPVKVVILVPDIVGAKTDISVALIDERHPENPFAVADGSSIEWTRFFDTAGRDSYLAGPMLEATVPRGTYQIRVWSSNNDSPYVLVVSGKEKFSIGETLHRYATLPSIKSQFFGKSAVQAYLTPLLLWPILGVLIVAGLIVFLLIILRRRSRAI